MFKPLTRPEQLLKKDTPNQLVLARPHPLRIWGGMSLILAVVVVLATLASDAALVGGGAAAIYAGVGLWLVTIKRSATFDVSRQIVFLSSRHLLFERNTRAIPFAEIAAIYLDYEEQTYSHAYLPQYRIKRKWRIFLVLNDKQTVTLIRHPLDYPVDRAPALSKQTADWEKLARKICGVTDKLLVRTPSVPGQAPHTFVGVIDQIIQRRLAALPATHPLLGRSVQLRSHPTGGLEIIVDGLNYRQLEDVVDPDVRALIQGAIDEWHSTL